MALDGWGVSPIGILVGSVVFSFPSALLGEARPWELELFRVLGLEAVALALIWPWARSSGRSQREALRRWVVGASLAVGLYLLGGSSLFLLLAFCLAAGGVLSSWMERAHQAANALAESLRRESRTDPEG